jgi:large subunit ribosomal protein L21
MNYSVIQIAGKQYKVTDGGSLLVNRLAGNVGDTLPIEKVLLRVTDSKVEVGAPSVTGVKLQAKIVEHLLDEKVRIAKFKAKSRYRRVTGHRQQLTKIEINLADAVKATAKPVKKTTTKKATDK